MKELVRAFQISAPLPQVWEALATGAGFSAWSHAPATIPAAENEPISLWDGDVTGRNVKIISQKQLVQEWLFSGWQKPTLVTFDFSVLPETDRTQILLTHTGIPDEDFAEINTGWDASVFDPIKAHLE